METFLNQVISISVLFLATRYYEDYKKHKLLLSSLFVFGVSQALMLIYYFVPMPLLRSLAGLGTFVVASVLFLIHVLKEITLGKNGVTYFVMAYTAGFNALSGFFKIMHYPGASIMKLIMLPGIILGIYISFFKEQVLESKLFNLIIVVAVLEVLPYLFYILS